MRLNDILNFNRDVYNIFNNIDNNIIIKHKPYFNNFKLDDIYLKDNDKIVSFKINNNVFNIDTLKDLYNIDFINNICNYLYKYDSSILHNNNPVDYIHNATNYKDYFEKLLNLIEDYNSELYIEVNGSDIKNIYDFEYNSIVYHDVHKNEICEMFDLNNKYFVKIIVNNDSFMNARLSLN